MLPEREREDAISHACSQPEIRWSDYVNFATGEEQFRSEAAGLVRFPSQIWRIKSNGSANPTAR